MAVAYITAEVDDKAKVSEVAELESEISVLQAELATPDEVIDNVVSVDPSVDPVAVVTSDVAVTLAPVDPAVQATMRAKIAELEQKLDKLTAYDVIPYIEIVNPSGFVNSDPFQLADLIGSKVILLKFTTYSCINCQRTYLYVNSWYDKYRDQGLAVVAIHTPEFSFEKDIDNVRAAMKKEGIEFPIVLDNDKSTWRAYGNRFWPRMYLIDVNGNIVYDHIGEGSYMETEVKIQALLAELE